MKRIQLETLIEGVLAKGSQLTYFYTNEIWLGDQLSNGGQSKVCEATVLIGGEEVEAVVKVVKDDEELEYAMQEVELLTECQEVLDSVVKIIGVTVVTDEDENGRRTYRLGIVLEKGDHDLATHIQNYTSTDSLVTLLELFYSIVESVYALHKHGIAHRDLKLENIIVQGGDLKIVDLGLATKTEKHYDAELNIVCGTKGYDAPEICLGEMDGEVIYDPKSVDFYSLGIMLFTLLLDRTKYNMKKCQKGISQATKRLHADLVIDRCVRGKLLCGDCDEALDIIRDLIEPDPCRRLTNARVLLSRVRKIIKLFKDDWCFEMEVERICMPISSRRRSGKENELASKPLKIAIDSKQGRAKRLQERNRAPRSPRSPRSPRPPKSPRSPRDGGKTTRKFIFLDDFRHGHRQGRHVGTCNWG
ncbi:uncharacterized protein LOC144439003 [Glandiceps talaboti]